MKTHVLTLADIRCMLLYPQREEHIMKGMVKTQSITALSEMQISTSHST